MKNNFEKWLIVALNNELKPNQKLLSEKKLSTFFKVHPSTIKKTVLKYINLGILISFQGKGVYVSPFWNSSEDKIRFTPVNNSAIVSREVIIPKKKILVPNEMKSKMKEPFIESQWDCFVKYAYNDQRQVVAYSINWINKASPYSAKYFQKNPGTLHEEIFNISFIHNKIVMLAAVEEDKKNFKNKSLDFIPTTFSYIFENQQSPIMIRLIKVLPKYFISNEIILKQKIFL